MKAVEEPELLAEAVIRDAEEFGSNKAHPANTGRDPYPGGNRGEGCGKCYIPDQVTAPRATEHLPCLDKDPGDAPEAAVGIDNDGKDRTGKDDEPGSRRRQPEPDDRKRDPREGRNRPEDFYEWIEECIEPVVPAHQDPDRDADKECHAKADGEVDQARLEVKEDRPLVHQADKRRKDIGGGRENEWVMDDDGRNKLPDRQCDEDRKETEPPVLPVFLIIPSHGQPADKYPVLC